MMQFHHHCFVTFWTRTWVLQLRVMKALEQERGCSSNILLKITIIANKVYCFLGWIVRLAEMQVSIANAKEDASKIV